MAKFESSDEKSKCSAFEEMDVSCRYGRYADVLGRGAIKIVYHAFDYREGIEVAWNKVSLMQCLNHYCMQRLYSEVSLLASLSHENILMFYDAWLDRNTKSINFITEFCPSGTLRQYRQKHKHVSMHALKNWACQILKGLNYLHSCNPPIIHRDLNCSNIFVEGNSGILKIGDLGLSCVLGRDGFAHSVVGTPEFMAPELYEENYDELVDIYSFGMCMLEMVTIEIPYSECSNVAQIYKKVACGGMPAVLGKVVDPQVRQLIEKCLAPRMVRPSAAELMMDPVFNEVHLI